jgi:hypothetical protein
MPFPVSRILSQVGIARPLQRDWKHPARSVSPALQAGSRSSDSQEMVGAGDVEARGAIEVGERDGGQPQADSAGLQGVVWDHAAFPKAKVVEEGGRPMLLSPTERVFAEVQRWVEGRRYERIEAKKAAVEEVLRRLEAEEKVSSLVGRRPIRQALNALPSRLRSCALRNSIRPSK